MKLIVIYGPPAVGKLTVARELEKLTGVHVFHNHRTIELLKPVFGDKPFSHLVDEMRIRVFEEAAKANVPHLIFTYVYAKEVDDKFIDDVISVVEKNGGEVSFVRLDAPTKVLQERVANDARKGHGKISDATTLASVLKEYDVRSPIPQRESLAIDTSVVSSVDAAKEIADYFKLAVQ